ncbi:hypothetical protein DDD_2190 [Nonlabens dokdonensis DSW-6]|uniref:Uncharacterized protein n=1 Tax=Nonlabens dokdonensis (strain DSM 17205 / KCTC 12402 / DSW-6) TaxID=592029 RepID=L7WAW4_NONDD|nr:hypothetical protein DDD_2190 [Nonlabens dokdonensis DSW-6]
MYFRLTIGFPLSRKRDYNHLLRNYDPRKLHQWPVASW